MFKLLLALITLPFILILGIILYFVAYVFVSAFIYIFQNLFYFIIGGLAILILFGLYLIKYSF